MGSSLILIVQIFCLAIWIGGSAVILLLVTPEIFGQIADRGHAGKLAGAILEKFRALLLVAGFILGITVWIQLIALGPAIALRLRLVLMLVSLSILIEAYVRFGVSNRMRGILAQSSESEILARKDEFIKLHKRSMRSFLLNLFIGIAVVITLVMPSS